MSGPLLDLSKQHFTVHRGNLTGIGTWVKTDDRWRQCLAIIRTGDELAEECVPCIVTIDRAWLWSEEVGEPRRCAHIVVSFLKALRMNEHDPKEHARLILFIQDHIGDLLKIPPHKPEGQSVVAELTMTERETGKVKEVEIREDV